MVVLASLDHRGEHAQDADECFGSDYNENRCFHTLEACLNACASDNGEVRHPSGRY